MTQETVTVRYWSAAAVPAGEYCDGCPYDLIAPSENKEWSRSCALFGCRFDSITEQQMRASEPLPIVRKCQACVDATVTP